jgi:hypothetical protein
VHAHAHNTIYAKVYAYVHVFVHGKTCTCACAWAKRMCPAVTVFGMEKGVSESWKECSHDATMMTHSATWIDTM